MDRLIRRGGAATRGGGLGMRVGREDGPVAGARRRRRRAPRGRRDGALCWGQSMIDPPVCGAEGHYSAGRNSSRRLCRDRGAAGGAHMTSGIPIDRLSMCPLVSLVDSRDGPASGGRGSVEERDRVLRARGRLSNPRFAVASRPRKAVGVGWPGGRAAMGHTARPHRPLRARGSPYMPRCRPRPGR